MSPLRRRGPGRIPDERGSIVLTLLLIGLFSILGLTMMVGATSQLQLSSNATTRNNVLQGALSGVQAAVAAIRTASTNGYVVPSQLPCTTVSGSTNTLGSPSYIASIQYYDQTPTGYLGIACTQGQGPATAASGDFLARAVVTSCSPMAACLPKPTLAPTGKSLWRRVVSTYTFNAIFTNIPGGLIYSYSNKECLLATFNNGIDASQGLRLRVTGSCAASNPMEQFSYTAHWNFELQLGGTGYCIQDPDVASLLVPLGPCTSTAVAQWGVDDHGEIEGVAAGGSPAGQPNSLCLTNPLSSDPGVLFTQDASVGGCTEAFNNVSTWQMSSSVGAGGSQPAVGQIFGVTNQLVNFQEFGFCLDVTLLDVTSPYLIDYMCKQFPDTADYPAWNQRWCFNPLPGGPSPNEGVLYTPVGHTTCSASMTSAYCLDSPLNPPGSLPSTVWVTVTPCVPTATGQTPNLLWTEGGDSGDTFHDYTWTDSAGLCLEANPHNKQNPSDYFSTIQVDTCDGSYQQKWNAPPTLTTSQIGNTHEGTGTGAFTGP